MNADSASPGSSCALKFFEHLDDDGTRGLGSFHILKKFFLPAVQKIKNHENHTFFTTLQENPYNFGVFASNVLNLVGAPSSINFEEFNMPFMPSEPKIKFSFDFTK